MARQLEALPPRHRGHHTREWPEEWLNLQPWIALAGEDYQCSHHAFVGRLRALASRRGLRVETRRHLERDGEQSGTYFQFSAGDDAA